MRRSNILFPFPTRNRHAVGRVERLHEKVTKLDSLGEENGVLSVAHFKSSKQSSEITDGGLKNIDGG